MRSLSIFILLLTSCFTPNSPPPDREENQLRRIAFSYEIPDLIVTDNVGDQRPFTNWVVYEHLSYREALYLFKKDHPDAVITDEDLIAYEDPQ